MRVAAIGVDPLEATPVLVLQEVGDRRRLLPIWVGAAEANAIELERLHATPPRPLAHQLIGQVIIACGRRLDHVCVTMIQQGVFHAELVISPDVRISARVSDAVAVALNLGVPIHAEDAVLDQAALSEADVAEVGEPPVVDDPAAYPAASDGPLAGDPLAGDVDEAEAVAELRRFLDNVTPDDFDKN